MRLSIIIPVYNVRQWLEGTVTSVLNQTYRDFELILVDDGSTDSSPAICDAYADMDPRIIVIHKENGGLSDARNAGLDIAKGEYIGFVDSDDFVHPMMYETMIRVSRRVDADIIQCSFYRFFEEDPICFAKVEDEPETTCLNAADFLVEYYPDNCHRFSTTVCNKLYKNKIPRRL